MKIVNLLGGLGNQMFEYAMYLALKDAHPEEEIKVCTRSFGGYGLHNGLEIQRVFGVELPEASLWELTKLAYPFFNYKTWQVMHHMLPHRKTIRLGTTQIPFKFDEVEREDSAYYDGHWQNEKNFKHIRQLVLETFAFPPFEDKRNSELAEKLSQKNSLSVHIRRGDYLKEPVWCVCTTDYYLQALQEMKRRTKVEMLCVFSDDIPWCKENLKEISETMDVVYVDWNKGKSSYCDMQLMTYCKHNIIANSTFSWWGAWLGQYNEKIVMAPQIWAKKPIVNDPICENWIRI